MRYFEDDNKLFLYFSEFDNYDDSELLFQRFQDRLGAFLIKKIYGPYSRIWLIKIHDLDFKLIIDEDYGSMLVAEDNNSIVLLKKLMNEIELFIQ
jgi:hypothetical protein